MRVVDSLECIRHSRKDYQVTTKVIFKKFPEGDIIACFPELVGDMKEFTCLSYQHLGQHGACDTWYMANLRPAAPEEYNDLLKELQSIGYDDLVIARRFTYKDQMKRKGQIK